MEDFSSHLRKAALMPQQGDLVQAFGSFYTVCGYDGKGNIRMSNAYGVLTIWATRVQPNESWWIVSK